MTLILIACAARATSQIPEILRDPFDRMRQKRTRRFGDDPRGGARPSPELFKQTRTDERCDWTRVVTYAAGTSCIVATGRNRARTGPKPGI